MDNRLVPTQYQEYENVSAIASHGINLCQSFSWSIQKLATEHRLHVVKESWWFLHTRSRELGPLIPEAH